MSVNTLTGGSARRNAWWLRFLLSDEAAEALLSSWLPGFEQRYAFLKLTSRVTKTYSEPLQSGLNCFDCLIRDLAALSFEINNRR